MIRGFLTLLAALAAPAILGAQPAPQIESSTVNAPLASPQVALQAPGSTTVKRVVVIPVRDEIAEPLLYVLRRGLKEAIEEKADVVVLDMNTPGGQLGVTFEIMEALAKFPGETVTYVNKEAVSAGAFISATTGEIWFAPDGVIGAAAPVTSDGKDVDVTMKQKVVSYLKARVRAVSEGKGYRGQVISAMIDEGYELKIDGDVIKEKGGLLSLTATEASKTYGNPAQPLLAAGIAKTIDGLLTQKFGAGNFTVKTLEITWSERLAHYLNMISPVLLGLGLLAVFIEIKTPGFGIFGVSGGILLAVVFFGHYVAGFSGHEPVAIFALGLVLVALEVFFFPGIAVVAVSGLVLMFGSLVWAMTDLWPGEGFGVAWSGDAFLAPLQNLALGLVLAVALGLLLARFLPKGLIWDRLVVGSTVGGTAQKAGGSPHQANEIQGLIGQRGHAVTALRPGGQIEIDGRRYEATVNIGSIDAGEAVVVRGRKDFNLVVERDAA